MANTPSGSKRNWESRYDADYQNKRPRDVGPKDWREVHLTSPKGSRNLNGSGSGGRGMDRRDYWRRDDYRKGGSGRDRRDDYDRDRDHRSRQDSSRRRSPYSNRDRRSPHISNGHPKEDSEKEEGE